MPVTLGGLAAGLNTDDIIKKLVEVEARPIRQWEDEKATFNRRKEALGELRNRVNAVNAAAKELYGFRASYADKSALSSNPGVIDASANRYAEKGVRRLEVLEMASTPQAYHRFPAGRPEVSGGQIQDRSERSVEGRAFPRRYAQGPAGGDRRGASDIVSTSYVNTTDNRHVLTLESKTSGKKGEINLSEGKDFLYAVGLVKGEKGEEKQKTSLVFDGKYFVPYAGAEPKTDDGSIDVDKDGKKISINGALWREYVLPAGVPAKKNTMLEFTVTHTPPEQEKDDNLPYRLEIGPDEKTVIKGIELHGYNVSRIRPLKKKEPKRELPTCSESAWWRRTERSAWKSCTRWIKSSREDGDPRRNGF
jgi:flagellar hook-associated protein 2